MTAITLDNLDRFLTNLKSMIGSKQDAAPSLTINTTNNTSAVSVDANTILVFNTLQTYSSKTFNIVAPPDNTNEYTWTIRFQLNTTNPTISFNAPSGYTLRWANNTVPSFAGNGAGYEITFKYIPGVNLLLGVCGEF